MAPSGPGRRGRPSMPGAFPAYIRHMIRWRHLLLVATALPGGSMHLHAQEPGKQTKVLLYKERLAAQWDTVKCVKNVFKLNPLAYFRGELPLYYERALSPRLSAEVAVGVTTRSFIGNDFAGDVPDDFSAGTRIIAKPSAHVGFRWYLTDDIEPQGAYLQGEFVYLDHSKDIFKKDSTGHLTDAALRDSRVYNDIRAYAGYQRLSSTSNWLFDVYGGIGLRNRSVARVQERLDLAERQWSYAVLEEHDQVPAFFLGIKIGYGF